MFYWILSMCVCAIIIIAVFIYLFPKLDDGLDTQIPDRLGKLMIWNIFLIFIPVVNIIITVITNIKFIKYVNRGVEK